ncbi:monocarboxylate transporter 9-like [Dermacentor albipictus]|uniref:monocarboxylate transporter 9-like n=1 Tax=Dermacentor albipictus TaxID=60249 RepID=UPI0031FD33A3
MAAPPQDSCWSIPLVAMSATFFLYMTLSSMGYLYVLLMEKFRASREMASWPESIMMLTMHLGGFVVTVLHSRLSIFYVALSSASLCCAGLLGAAFAPDIKWMIVMLGAVYGTGAGASIISLTVYTMLYFDKYRATATAAKYVGIAASGIAGPLFFSAAASNYGLGGSLLIGAAIAMNALPLEIFLRIPRPLVFRFQWCNMRNMSGTEHETRKVTKGSCKDVRGIQKDSNSARPAHTASPGEVNLSALARNVDRSEVFCDRKITSDGKAFQAQPLLGAKTSAGNSQSRKCGSICLDRDGRISYGTSAATVLQLPSESSKSILEQLALFRRLAFYVLLVVYVLCDWTMSMHTTTIVDYGCDKGSPLEKAKLVLTFNAAGQFVGMTLLPFASDNVAHSRCPLAVACFVGSGACLAFMPSVQTLSAFIALNLVLGVCQGFQTCIRSVLVNDHCGVERLPTFFGMLGLTMVPLSFSGPTIIGFFRDTLGSYDNLYRMMGALHTSIALLLFVLVWRDKTRRKSCDLPIAAIGHGIELGCKDN